MCDRTMSPWYQARRSMTLSHISDLSSYTKVVADVSQACLSTIVGSVVNPAHKVAVFDTVRTPSLSVMIWFTHHNSLVSHLRTNIFEPPLIETVTIA